VGFASYNFSEKQNNQPKSANVASSAELSTGSKHTVKLVSIVTTAKLRLHNKKLPLIVATNESTQQIPYAISPLLQMYIKEDSLKLSDKGVTCVVSGVQADELKNYLPTKETKFSILFFISSRVNSALNLRL
jgi:hypothetical protein